LLLLPRGVFRRQLLRAGLCAIFLLPLILAQPVNSRLRFVACEL
jgi:hypothetical protein